MTLRRCRSGLASQPYERFTITRRADIDTTVLLLETGGAFQGRFLLTPLSGARPAREQRLLAIAFADQAGAALAVSHPAARS